MGTVNAYVNFCPSSPLGASGRAAQVSPSRGATRYRGVSFSPHMILVAALEVPWYRRTSSFRPRWARRRQSPRPSARFAGVIQAEDVTGPYDVIVRAQADTVDELGRMVVAKVQQVDGITRTLTCPVVHL